MMQESYESLLLLEFPLPKATLVSEEELGGPDPNDSKEWEILRVAPVDDGTWSGNDEDPPAADNVAQARADLPLSHGIKDAASHFPAPLSPSRIPGRDCGKRFARNSNRKAHQRSRSHSQAIPESGNAVSARLPPCSECGMSFPRSSNPTGKKPWECPGCGNSRRRKRLGMRPQRCAECGKSFRYSSAFLKHQRKHGSQDRALQHSQPGNCIPGSSGLSRHHRSHLG